MPRSKLIYPVLYSFGFVLDFVPLILRTIFVGQIKYNCSKEEKMSVREYFSRLGLDPKVISLKYVVCKFRSGLNVDQGNYYGTRSMSQYNCYRIYYVGQSFVVVKIFSSMFQLKLQPVTFWCQVL